MGVQIPHGKGNFEWEGAVSCVKKRLNRSRCRLGGGSNGPRNHALDGVQIRHEKGQFWGGKGRPIVKYTDQDAVWVRDLSGPKETCIIWGPDPPWEAAILMENGRPVVKYSDSLPCAVKNGWTDRDAVWDLDSSGPKEACIRRGSHWRHLTNTTEPSMCGGDATCCKITLTTCLTLPLFRCFRRL